MLELRKFCKNLSDESAKIIKPYFRSNFEMDIKSDNSPVTIADKKAEEIMRELIMKEYPDHGILGEEFGTHNENADYQWILDPIDGTKSFIYGALTFGTLIALLHKGKPILGVINQPILNEFMIGDNETTTLNDNQIKVKECNNLSDALLLTTDHLNVEEYQNAEKFDALIRKVKLYRNWGDCYGYGLVAGGFAEIMIDPIMSPWDFPALIPIINGADGMITDYHGNDPIKGNSIIASSKGIHQQIVDLLN